MELSELITSFKDMSGRIDLSDSEVTKFLNRGSRFLDRRDKRGKKESRAFYLTELNQFVITTSPDLRHLKSVWANTATKRWELYEMDFDVMRDFYNQSPTAVPVAPVVAYSHTPVTLGLGGPADGGSPSGDFFSQWGADILLNNNQGAKGLVLWPISDEVVSVEVIGNYYTPALEDSDGHRENWWSINYEDFLLRAALIELALGYNNAAVARDILVLLDADLDQLYFDEIEDDNQRPRAIGGSIYGYKGDDYVHD